MKTQFKSSSRNGSTRAGSGNGKDLSDLFVHGLKDMYYAEKKILKSLPKLIKAAGSEELVDALNSHREETEGHVSKLERVFALLDKAPRTEKCEAIDGILEEGDGLLEDFGDTQACDSAIIFAAKPVEHYEITRYRSLYAFANVLGYSEAAEILAGIMDEERTADETLSRIADERIDVAAAEKDETAGDAGEDYSRLSAR